MSKKVKKSISEVTEVASANFEAFKAEAEYMTDVCGKRCRVLNYEKEDLRDFAEYLLNEREWRTGEPLVFICEGLLGCILAYFSDSPELITGATYTPTIMDGRTDLSLPEALRQLKQQIEERGNDYKIEDIFAIFQICATFDFDVLGTIRAEVKSYDTPEVHEDFHYYF